MLPTLELALIALTLSAQAELRGLPDAGAHAASLPGEPAPDQRRIELAGEVLDAAGRAAEGALVVSSAGGRATVDREGRFRLEVELPPEAESLRVTAVRGSGAATAVASARVAIDARGGAGSTDSLVLVLQPGDCPPGWLPAIGPRPGVNGQVNALAVYDDGSGPALYVAGFFDVAGSTPVSRIARWDGTAWSNVGGGVFGNGVHALMVFDDGSGAGPSLFAGGQIFMVGTQPANGIARWNGSIWRPLGNGIQGIVLAMAAFDDGSGGGPALYVGGQFTTAGTVAANNVARWDGSSWSTLGAGVNDVVRALAVFDDGTGQGPALHAGGYFLNAGGAPANHIASWDGAGWSALGQGVNSFVLALTVFDDGGGPALYAGGAFTLAGQASASRVAKWDGEVWRSLAGGTSGIVRSLMGFDDGQGGGPALYAGGDFPIVRWDGAAWSSLPNPLFSWITSLAAYDDGSGVPALFIGGRGDALRHVARWSPPSWSVLGQGLNASVQALAVFREDPAEDPRLFLGGVFTRVGDVIAQHVASWDGPSPKDVGGGTGSNTFSSIVHALTTADLQDGAGLGLFAGGRFTSMGGQAASRIARWNGTSWSGLSSGVNDWVLTLGKFDGGSGPQLYAGGPFTTAGGAITPQVARWNGGFWGSVGSGHDNTGSPRAMQVFDDGSGAGPALYVGGGFTSAGGQPASRIARWDGASWSALGSGLDNIVHALAVFDDGSGSGPALYAGGSFSVAGGVPAHRIARWDGQSWSTVGSGMGTGFTAQVEALAVFDDGSGPALYAGGTFSTAGGVAAKNLARWDGQSWSGVGGGLNGLVTSFTVYDDGTGTGPALFVGGGFLTSPAGDSFLAKWGRCAPASPGTPFCFGDGTGTACPCGNTGAPGHGCANGAGSGALLAASGSASVSAADLVLQGSGLVPSQFGLYFQGDERIGGGAGMTFGDGLRCAGVAVERIQTVAAGASGDSSTSIDVALAGGVQPGDTKRYQLWYRDPLTSPCGSGFNLSNGLEIAWTP